MQRRLEVFHGHRPHGTVKPIRVPALLGPGGRGVEEKGHILGVEGDGGVSRVGEDPQLIVSAKFGIGIQGGAEGHGGECVLVLLAADKASGGFQQGEDPTELGAGDVFHVRQGGGKLCQLVE